MQARIRDRARRETSDNQHHAGPRSFVAISARCLGGEAEGGAHESHTYEYAVVTCDITFSLPIAKCGLGQNRQHSLATAQLESDKDSTNFP